MIAWLPDGLRFADGFAWPWLLFAWSLPWCVRLLLPAATDRVAGLRMPGTGPLAPMAHAGIAPRRGAGAPWLAWIAWTLLCVAAARPFALGDVVQPPASARNLTLAVDLSGSMGETDMRLGGSRVDRLTAAKAVIADFLERRAGDRIGLIVFGQRAYALTPQTLDRDSVREQLAGTMVGLAGRDTAIGDAIALAVKRLSSQSEGRRVLVLLTDGVNSAGVIAPERAAQLAHDRQVRVYTIAFGGDGERSLFGFGGGGGSDVDEVGLRKIAALTGGRAFRARDAEELAGVYAEVERLEPVRQPAPGVRPRIERYPWPLALALGCALFVLLRRERAA